jgi:hypothetical protein
MPKSTPLENKLRVQMEAFAAQVARDQRRWNVIEGYKAAVTDELWELQLFINELVVGQSSDCIQMMHVPRRVYIAIHEVVKRSPYPPLREPEVRFRGVVLAPHDIECFIAEMADSWAEPEPLEWFAQIGQAQD